MNATLKLFFSETEENISASLTEAFNVMFALK